MLDWQNMVKYVLKNRKLRWLVLNYAADARADTSGTIKILDYRNEEKKIMKAVWETKVDHVWNQAITE